MAKSAVVLGAGMGGLSAAIYAKLAGFDVLVLEKTATPGGKAAGITLSGYELDPGPSIIILLEIYERLFRDAGRRMDDYLQFQRLPVLTRVFFGDDPYLDIPGAELDALAILKEISGPDAKALEGLLHAIEGVEPLLWSTIYDHPFTKPYQLLDPRLAKFAMALKPLDTFKSAVDKLFTSDFMKAFFYGFPSYGGQSYNSRAPGAFLIPYYMFRTGVHFPVGGVRAIPEAFYRIAKELGVEFQFGVEVKGLDCEKGRVKSVLTAEGRHEADVFISNIDPLTLAKLNGETVNAKPSYSYFTIHLGVRKAFDLEHHNLFVPSSFKQGFAELYEAGRFPSQPIVYLNSTSHLDPKAAPNGCSNLFAVVTCPSRVETCPWKDTAPYEAATLARIHGRGITWNPGDVEFKRIQQPSYFEQQHGNFGGSLYGVDESQRLWGSFPTPNLDPKLRNLAYVGGGVQPGAGLPMVTLSGKFAVRALSGRVSS